MDRESLIVVMAIFALIGAATVFLVVVDGLRNFFGGVYRGFTGSEDADSD